MTTDMTDLATVDRRYASLRSSTRDHLECIPVSDFAVSMRQLASGVAIVTSFVDGQPWGTTLSSVSSFSADPARISLSITKSNVTAAYIREHESFGVAVLAHENVDLAAALAAPGKPKFIPEHALLQPGPAFGLPAIAGALVNLECQVVFDVEAVDHLMVVADIVSAAVRKEPGQLPLTYFDRTFSSITTTPPLEVK